MMSPLPRAFRSLLLSLAVVACGGAGPREIVLGHDECGYCRMSVSDARFAAQAVTNTGRVHVFDSVECLAGYARSAEPGTLRTLWVTDAEAPGQFVEAERAGYLLDASLRGPMGRAVAFANLDAAREAQARYGGTIADWSRVLADSSAHTVSHGGH
jgi:copper chaperone NosL